MTHSLAYTHSLTRTPVYTLIHLHIHSLTHSYAHIFTHPHTHTLTRSLTHSLAQPPALAPSVARIRSHSRVAHTLIPYSLAHTFTHALIAHTRIQPNFRRRSAHTQSHIHRFAHSHSPTRSNLLTGEFHLELFLTTLSTWVTSEVTQTIIQGTHRPEPGFGIDSQRQINTHRLLKHLSFWHELF